MSVETRAIDVATAFYKSRGYLVANVSRKPGHNGYDLFLTRDTETLKVEVKGCTREWHIPDLYVTEFDADRRLIADLLCVVYFIEGRDPRVCQIPREAIAPEYVTPKLGYRISSRFKKRSHLEQYMQPHPAADSDEPPRRDPQDS